MFDLHTVKPLDEEAIIVAAKKTCCVVTAKEHQINGGMGSAVAECLAKYCPVPMEMAAVNDSFGQSGQPQELMDKYGLNQAVIIDKVRSVIARR